MRLQYTLPQNDPSEFRQKRLRLWRGRYRYKKIGKIPVNADASILDSVMDLAWDASICRSIFKIRTNLEKVLQKTGWRFSRGIPSLSTREFATYLARKDMPKLTEYFIADLGFALDGGRPKHIDDYRKVFVTREVPEVADRYLSDASFANAFVAGANPLLLKRMDHSLPNFPIRQQHLQNVAACRDDDLVTAMAEQRVYYVDFKILGGLRPGKHYQQPKYVYQPLCAFVVPREGGLMQPFAIQLGQESESREIYTPVDGWSWQIAKSMVMVAYSNHHEAVSHLAETHLLLEPIVVSTYRQLSHRHPLYALFFIILRVPCRSTIWLLPGYCSQVNHLTL